MSAQRTCSTPGCDRVYKARGWCHTCYSRWWYWQPKPLSSDGPVLDEILLERILALRVEASARQFAAGNRWSVPSGRAVHVPLKDRHLYIERLVARGWTRTQISRALGLSGTTTARFVSRCAA